MIILYVIIVGIIVFVFLFWRAWKQDEARQKFMETPEYKKQQEDLERRRMEQLKMEIEIEDMLGKKWLKKNKN